MTQLDLEKRTSVNVQEKANLIWAIADKIVGVYKPHEYGNVILPMCVIKRFSDTLAPTKAAVLKKNEELTKRKVVVKKGLLAKAAGYDFYNVSPFTFEKLLADPESIAENFRFYLQGFSDNVIDIIQKFEFDHEITKLADNMKHGNTLSDDKFEGFTFDYIISNPPFGIEWKNEKKKVEEEAKKGAAGRFGAGLPAIGDSQQLFMLNGIAKLKDTGRMAIIQNGSPLFKGDAGSGESNIRGHLLENDWLEAIVQLPNDMFYNTGIATYIWIVSKNKSRERQGKVQLIDASKCFEKRRKSLGNKRNEFTESCIALVEKAYLDFSDKSYTDGEKRVESKIKDNDDFKFTKITLERPLRDENGVPVLKKGKPQIESDTESVPFKEDIDTYLRKNVLPYAPDSKINPKKTKIGYEIPFTREFYKYTPPRPSSEIFDELKRLEAQEAALMKKLLGK